MAEKAQIVDEGGTQTVRLPESCRFPADQREVIVRREGLRVILEPVEGWPSEFLEILGSIDEEIERPPQTPISKVRDPFS